MGTPVKSSILMSQLPPQKEDTNFLPRGGMFVKTRSLVGGRESIQIRGENNHKYTKKDLNDI